MATYLHGISAKNYRGIGPSQERAGPFSECNFFIGTNNSGKSNFLNLIASHLNAITDGNRRDAKISLQPLEIHLGASISEVEIGFAIPLEEANKRLQLQLNQGPYRQASSANVSLERLLEKISHSGLIWMTLSVTKLSDLKFQDLNTTDLKREY